MLRLHRLDYAIIAFEEDAFASGFIDERKPQPIQAQLGVTLDELMLAQAQMSRHAGDLFIANTHLTRPATAGRAALAF